jgi:hypothetical protein
MPILTAKALAAATICVATLACAGVASAATPDPRLLAAYQPVTRFDPAEQFNPTSVESFIADADLERLDPSGNWVVVDSDPDPGSLPGPGTGTWRLNQDLCSPASSLGGLTCYASAWETGSGASTVYGRVARTDDRIVLQYWYFYYDDTYSYFYPPSDVLWQAHEGDWEVVNVVLSPDEQPLEVAYSQHCLGQRRAWTDAPRIAETHPLVYVAAGSHANYFSPGTHPIDARCVPPQVLATLAALHLPPPVDRTGEGAVAGPPQTGGQVTTIHEIGRGVQAWEDFPGLWGELQYFHAPLIGTVAFGASPTGPAFHAVWTDPVGTLASWPDG